LKEVFHLTLTLNISNMSDQKHGQDELFTSKATDADDSSEDAVSNTYESEQKPVSKDEENKQGLEPAEKARDEFKNAAIRDIKSGVKTLGDYADKPWLQQLVSQDLAAEKKEQTTLAEDKAREIAREMAREEMAIERTAVKFDTLKEQLNAAGTTKAQRAEIKSQFDRFKVKLGSHDALQTAIKLAGVDLDDMSYARRATSVPTLGGGVTETNEERKVMDLHKLSHKQVQELAKSKSKSYRGR